MIDRELVTRKMVLITGDLNALVTLAAKPRDAYLLSDTDEILVERRLERVIDTPAARSLTSPTGFAPHFSALARLDFHH